MGAIQNSVNNTLNTVAAALVASKHMEDKKAQSEEQGLLAKQQYHEAKADVTQLEGESQVAGENLANANKIYDEAMAKRYGGKGNTKAAIAEKQKAALTEKEAAQRAFDILADKIEARQAMMSRAEKIMKRTGTWGGMR